MMKVTVSVVTTFELDVGDEMFKEVVRGVIHDLDDNCLSQQMMAMKLSFNTKRTPDSLVPASGDCILVTVSGFPELEGEWKFMNVLTSALRTVRHGEDIYNIYSNASLQEVTTK